jgi:hypothetical protein
MHHKGYKEPLIKYNTQSTESTESMGNIFDFNNVEFWGELTAESKTNGNHQSVK